MSPAQCHNFLINLSPKLKTVLFVFGVGVKLIMSLLSFSSDEDTVKENVRIPLLSGEGKRLVEESRDYPAVNGHPATRHCEGAGGR